MEADLVFPGKEIKNEKTNKKPINRDEITLFPISKITPF